MNLENKTINLMIKFNTIHQIILYNNMIATKTLDNNISRKISKFK